MAKKPKKRASFNQQQPKPQQGLNTLTPHPTTPVAPAPQAPPVDPAYAAWQQQLPALQGNVYAEYGNPGLLNDPNASFVQRYGYQGQQLLNSLGLTEGGEIDPSNPYGQASLLQRSYQQSQHSIRNSLGDRGQGYSSYQQNKQDDASFDYNRQNQGIRDSFSSGLHGISQYALGALNDLNTQGIDRLGDHVSFSAAHTPKPGPGFMYVPPGSNRPAGSGGLSEQNMPGSQTGQLNYYTRPKARRPRRRR